ncbi:MAG TPA: ATP-binding protein [Thermoanaerobaculia bacterium]|nr:ATP-binding protein [Thermoanaerobaculia bacterium]
MDLVIFVGLPASGKSTYYLQHFAATHVHVSKDLMKNARDRDAMQELMIEKALAKGKPVVVDNTNPSPASREPLIALGRRLGARIVGYYFDLPMKVALERNRARQGKERVPDVAIFVTAKKMAAPKFEEGFDEIHVVA